MKTYAVPALFYNKGKAAGAEAITVKDSQVLEV